ncbi:MAG: glycosyltransferase family 4 protein [Methanogenium sp.]
MDKTKVLLISDSIQRPTGVAIQSLKLCKGLLKTGKYQVIQIAGGDHSSPSAPIYFEGVKLYTTEKPYGDPQLLRYIMAVDKPEVVVAFSDPRFFTWLFQMDNEVRDKARLVFYHTWDNYPFPQFNLPWYASCDEVVMLSNFSYQLMSSNGVNCRCIPHGMDPTEFYPLDEESIKKARQDFIAQSHAKGPVNFVVFWNNRNIYRKRPGDILWAYKIFSEKHPDSMLVLNTDIADREGIDLMHFIDDQHITAPIIFNPQRIPSHQLNVLYNISDVTVNIAYNEGFGLCVAESLCAGTPVIVTETGGMTEQARTVIHHPAIDPGIEGNDGKGCPEHDEVVEYGKVLAPDARSMFGTVGAPYIFQDIVDSSSLVKALEEAYQGTKEGTWKKKIGPLGREHIIQNFHIDTTIRLWDEFLQGLLKKPSSYNRWKVTTI